MRPKWYTSIAHYTCTQNFNEALGNVPLTALQLYRGKNPCLYKGILCANQEAKGDVLEAFLDLYHLKPLQIISFQLQAHAHKGKLRLRAIKC